MFTKTAGVEFIDFECGVGENGDALGTCDIGDGCAFVECRGVGVRREY